MYCSLVVFSNSITVSPNSLRSGSVYTTRPTLIECIRFQGKERIINLPQEIGTSYDDFGLLLLDDHNGRRIHSIARQHEDDAQQINKEVLKEWIAGRGKHPVQWRSHTRACPGTGPGNFVLGPRQ